MRGAVAGTCTQYVQVASTRTRCAPAARSVPRRSTPPPGPAGARRVYRWRCASESDSVGVASLRYGGWGDWSVGRGE
eukprot:4612694-Prymnesium_polylepis.1